MESAGLEGSLRKFLGDAAVNNLKKSGVDLGAVEDGKPPQTVEIDFALAGKTLGAATQAIRERFGKRAHVPAGPNAADVEAPPIETIEANAKKEADGTGAPTPEKGESMRKLAAKAAGAELPVIKATPELLKLLDEGQVEEFNKQRPAGRLDLTGINIAKRNLTGIDLRHCEMERSNLGGADLTGALLQYANLDRAVLESATLTDAKFFNANLNRANLQKIPDARGAQFATAILTSAEMNDSHFDGANFSDAKMLLAALDHSTFRGAMMSRANLARTTVTRTIFDGALLDEARFYQSRGKDVSFKDAILVGGEAVASEFTSSNHKINEKEILRTTFEGAWVQDFVHKDAIPQELLRGARMTGLPPEGLLPKIGEVDKGKILIDGLPGTDKVLYDAAWAELNDLIGLKDFKARVPVILSHVKASVARQSFGYPEYNRKLHYAIVGPPGVGKSTCSRILAKFFRSMGLLTEGHAIETDKSGFIAKFAGQTLSQTNELIDDSLGGALIADEIYALTDTTNDDYAKDALVVMVKRMWDDRYKFAAFFLGYADKMKIFIAANPGFDRRLAGIIELPANTSGELVDILKIKMDKLVLHYTPEMLAMTSFVMAINKELKQEKFGNAGTVENFVEELSKLQSARLDRDKLMRTKDAHTHVEVEDLPVKDFAKLPLDKLPSVSELTWVDDAGKTYKFKDLPKNGPFPNLSPESQALAVSFIEKYDLVDIDTKI